MKHKSSAPKFVTGTANKYVRKTSRLNVEESETGFRRSSPKPVFRKKATSPAKEPSPSVKAKTAKLPQKKEQSTSIKADAVKLPQKKGLPVSMDDIFGPEEDLHSLS